MLGLSRYFVCPPSAGSNGLGDWLILSLLRWDMGVVGADDDTEVLLMKLSGALMNELDLTGRDERNAESDWLVCCVDISDC